MNSFVFGLVSVGAATIVWGLQFPVAADVCDDSDGLVPFVLDPDDSSADGLA